MFTSQRMGWCTDHGMNKLMMQTTQVILPQLKFPHSKQSQIHSVWTVHQPNKRAMNRKGSKRTYNIICKTLGWHDYNPNRLCASRKIPRIWFKLLLYSRRTRQGIKKAANFPSPVAVQQNIFFPSRIPEISLSWTACRPMLLQSSSQSPWWSRLSRPTRSCQQCPKAIIFKP